MAKNKTIDQNRNLLQCLVYIEIEIFPSLEKVIDRIIARAKCSILDLQKNNFELHTPHISLSKVINFRSYQSRSFFELLKKKLTYIRSFPLYFSKVGVLKSETSDKSFLVVEVGSNGYEKLNEILQLVDKSMESMHRQKYHKEPNFHFSIAHTSMNINEELKCLALSISEDFHELLATTSVFVDHISVKVGTENKSITLA